MKTLSYFFIVFFLVSFHAFALNNYWFEYFALDSSGQLLPDENGTLTVKATIFDDSGILYQEEHFNVSTNQFGIFKINIGNGNKLNGVFSQIHSYADKRIKLEVKKRSTAYVVVLVIGLSESVNGFDNDWIIKGNDMFSAVSGNIGIGTESPSQKLDIENGNIEIDNTSHDHLFGVVYRNGKRFLHNFIYGNNGTVTTIGLNTFLGEDAGNFTMGENATWLGHGGLNTGIGAWSLQSNKNGFANTAVGFGGLWFNEDGYRNTAIGVGAMTNNKNGFHNVAVGNNSLENMYSAAYCIGIGVGAGTWVASTNSPHRHGSECIYIGTSTNALNDNDTNEIVIGHNMNGLGSHSVLLGTYKTEKTVLFGNLGLGTTNPQNLISLNANTNSDYKIMFSENNSPYVSIFYEGSAGSGTNNKLHIRRELSGLETNLLTIELNGNIGIGTSSPARKLHINDAMRYMDDGTNTSNGNPKLMVYDGTTWQECW